MTRKVFVIYGPPGTGKTTDLIGSAQREAASVGRLLYLSYTRASAQESASRVAEKYQDRIRTSTLHALAFAQLGVNRASIVDQRKKQEFSLTSGIPFKKPGEDIEDQVGDEFMAIRSYAANQLIDVNVAYDKFGRPGNHAMFEMFNKAYSEWKQTYGYLDFDDMLLLSVKTRYQGAPVVILDEAQDCSPLQWLVFEQVIRAAQRVYIAGDDDQAIYEWSGADPHGIAKFAEKHDAHVRVLEQSYRLPRAVFVQANTRALDQMEKREVKEFKPKDAPGHVQWFGDIHDMEIGQYKGKDTMILVRDGWRMKEIQRQLHYQQVPYTIANGASPYENKYAKAIRQWESGESDKIDRTLLRHNALTERSITRWQDALIMAPNLMDFYEHCDLDGPNTVVLSTVHAAKGKEADNVIVDLTMPARVERGCDLDRDAELRVLYVSLTRAKEELSLCGSNPLI